ncbi:hypothetical protein SDC9_198726 [bioreactor metagenome]|uniref:Uncharacterized protein n=1 Tax=bioreactor metagenome TaxID=1076179 RepID=A0A645IIG8_9ZZZZ
MGDRTFAICFALVARVIGQDHEVLIAQRRVIWFLILRDVFVTVRNARNCETSARAVVDHTSVDRYAHRAAGIRIDVITINVIL